MLYGNVWYPGAIRYGSAFDDGAAPGRLGIVIHWTDGVDSRSTLYSNRQGSAHFLIQRDGDVYQFVGTDRRRPHAFDPANSWCVGIEHELTESQARGDGWTDRQYASSVKLAAWLCARYSIPIVHAHPRGSDAGPDLKGLMGHLDLSLGHVGPNDHTDTVPNHPGWSAYLKAIAKGHGPKPTGPLPNGDSLRLVLPWHAQINGWAAATPYLLNIARNGLNQDSDASIAWKGDIWRGGDDVANVAKHLARLYLGYKG